jgi:integrase
LQKKEPNNIYHWNYYVFFNIAFYTSARKGEIHALKWSDIYGDTIHIRRSITQKLKGGDRETPPKNKSSNRNVQVPLPLKNVLDEHYKRYQLADGFTDE